MYQAKDPINHPTRGTTNYSERPLELDRYISLDYIILGITR